MPIKKYLPFVVVGILALNVPLFIFLAQNQQDIRQNASEIVSCNSTEQEKIGIKNNSPRQAIAATYSAKLKTLLATYRNADKPTRSQLRQQLHDLLNERKTALITAMRTNPKSAINQINATQSTPDSEPISSNCIEKSTQLSGTVHIEHVDFTDKTTKNIYTLTTADNRTISLHNPEAYPNQLYSGAQLTAYGYLLDQDFLINNDQSITLTNSNPPLLQANVVTTRKVAVLLVNFSDTTKPTATVNQVNTTFADVTSFHKENSYGKVNLVPTIHGWYQLDMASTCSNTSTLSAAAMSAANNDFDFTGFDHIMIVAPFKSCGWGGLGDVGSFNRTTPDGKKLVSFSFINAGPFISSVTIEHELGHNLGSYHAAFGDNTYGDIFDIMGGFTGEMNAAHKDIIGAFSTGDVKTVTTNGSYSIIPIETQTPGTKALRIDAGTSGIYYIEFRQPLGADATYDQQNFPGTTVFQGALIHKYLPKKVDTIDTYLLAQNSSQIAEKAALILNSTFTLSGTNAKIKTTSVNSQSLSVAISGLESIIPNPTTTPLPSPTQKPLSVNGTTYIDTNDNRTLDTGDLLYTPPTIIELRKDDGSLTYPTISQSVTTSHGSYTFANLSNGDYKVSAEIPNTYTSLTGNPIYVHITSANVTINFGLKEVQVVPTATPTPRPTIVVTPTANPTLAVTPTNTPSPTITRAITPTNTPTPTDAHLLLSLLLHGIGKAGDNTNPGSNGTLNPQTTKVNATLAFTNISTSAQFFLTVPFTYNPAGGNFTEEFYTPKIPSGKYIVNVTIPKYLPTTYPQIISIQSRQTTTLPQLSLIVGDIISDNRINILDYDILLGCIQHTACSQNEKLRSDLNDDGKTDQDDLNLFLREIYVFSGDSPN